MGNEIINDLRGKIEGGIFEEEEIISGVSEDFGRIIKCKPLVVVKPRSSKDLAVVMKYAYSKEITVSIQGSAHSQSGQSLNKDGILIDLKSLDKIYDIDIQNYWVLADSGVIWKNLVEKTIAYGLIPPVLTNNLNVTLGGTHSMAGLGISSFRYGTQADNCIAMEVVSPEGEILFCSEEENSELFCHTLCGLGQFSIISKIKHRLRKFQPNTKTFYLLYDDIDILLEDALKLMKEDRIDYIEGWAVAAPQGFKTFQGTKKPLIYWFFPLHITIETNDDNENKSILEGLKYYRWIHTELQSIFQFSLRLEPLFELWKRIGYWDNSHPWMECMLPWSKASEYISKALNMLPPYILGGGHILLWPATKKYSKLPLFQVPQEDFILGFGILPGIPKKEVDKILPLLNLLSDLCIQHGGKRYLSGWIQFNLQQWENHFNDYFNRLKELKNIYDPKRILNRGFIPL